MRIDTMTAVRHNVALRSRACRWIQWRDGRSSRISIATAEAEWIVMLAKDNIDRSSEFRSRSEDTAIGELDADCVCLFCS